MATAKALAQGARKPLVAVPTLEALAYTQCSSGGLVSPVMNARRQEVYTALFSFQGQDAQEIEPAQAIDPAKWVQVLAGYHKPVILVGDGVEVYSQEWASLGERAVLPPAVQLGVRAGAVAWLGRKRLLNGETDDLYSLKPYYIRPVEAQARLTREN